MLDKVPEFEEMDQEDKELFCKTVIKTWQESKQKDQEEK